MTLRRISRMAARLPRKHPRTSLQKRLLPLHVATLLLGTALWVPVEKLFMNEIGFDAASVGIMAAVYAAVPPIIEIPSGILADRWSRRGVLIVSSIAASLSVAIGGISTSVPVYFASAFFLGVFFAMRSGTMEAVVYDTVLEESGGSEEFEGRIGRLRMIESAALVGSGLAGGLLAGFTSPRLTYFVTVPLTALSIVAFLKFREPQLHKAAEPISLRGHLDVTYRTIARRGQLRPVVALAVLTSLIMTVMFEFGPLWLVALAASTVLYGPHWAGLMSTLGLGGLLAGKLRLDRPATVGGIAGLTIGAGLLLTTSTDVVVVTVAQIVLVLLMVVASIHVTRLLHDAVPSTIRAGVASGVGAISWMTFLPFALAFGLVSDTFGVHPAGWMIVGVTVLTAALLTREALAHRRGAASVETAPAPPAGAAHMELAA
jgi:MFS family permease